MSKKVRIAVTAGITVAAVCLAVLVFAPAGMTLAAELAKSLAPVAVAIVVLVSAENGRQHAKEARAEAQQARLRDANRA